MWNYAGIVRTNKRLSRALHRIYMLRDEVQWSSIAILESVTI